MHEEEKIGDNYSNNIFVVDSIITTTKIYELKSQKRDE